MKRHSMPLSVIAIALLSSATPALGWEDATEAPRLRSPQMEIELRSRAARPGVASTSSDTTWVGYTPQAVSVTNWWGVYAGSGKGGFNRPINGQPHQGVWDWETTVHGDSLQGWWPLINPYNYTGGFTQSDRSRTRWALDYGNMANYRINQNNRRTFGVLGVWHRDAGALAPAPSGLPSPEWTPAQGGHAAWMGLRAHGDETYADAITGNPFNEDVLQLAITDAVSASGNDHGFPGYGSQMDQILYRDIDLAGNSNQSLTIRFKFRTVMSKSIVTTAATRAGWFDSDPLGYAAGTSNPVPNSFISSTDAGDALAPRDSFMVYVGQATIDSSWSPAAASYGQSFPPRPVHDPQRRWFGEVIRWDRDPLSPSSNPTPRYYKELLSVAGNWPAGSDSAATPSAAYVDTSFTISSSALQPLIRDGRVRLAFRVKTNRGFDDQATTYSSNQRGAAVVDRVSYRIGNGSEVMFGDFENAADIDNDLGVNAVDAWKSTGKPPAIFHHTHLFADLIYEDLCGQKGDVSRVCNMSGVVVSMGNHEYGEMPNGGLSGDAYNDRRDGILSPTIQLCGPFDQPGGRNRHGFTAPGNAGDADATGDYYVSYDIYTDAMDPFTTGNLWFVGAMCYPAASKDPDGAGPAQPYPAWGQLRFAPFQFNGNPVCFTYFDGLKAKGLIRTSNANGIPDSMRIYLGKISTCFRISWGCEATGFSYWDNVSLGLVDQDPAPIAADPWSWLQDAFPASETAGLPGTASFDTAAAHVKTGLNIAPITNNNLRFDVPGDSIVITSPSMAKRMDLVFRILPGPGNYEPVGRPDVGTIVRRPDNRILVTKGDGSFWDEYRQNPGDFASPNAVILHHNALGGWDPNVWNSARCDTAELNLFPRMNEAAGSVTGPLPPITRWMATYHESDPHFATLGIVKNRCFVAAASGPATDIVCNGTVPSYVSARPEHADVAGTTRECTKIIPDGLLTPGAHLEYFIRAQQGSDTPGAADALCPDTSIVVQTMTEASTDAHRWQQMGVLPNAWKKPSYFHPVTQTFGAGPACLLVVDGNDRRGNETVWVSIADTIGATPQRWWGAHNGWHAVGGGNLDDPADNRRGADGSPGFVSEHLGQPGSGGSWDMYQVKGAESGSNVAGSLGSRKSNRTGGAGQQIVIDKTSRIGPTAAMLNAYYPMMLYLSGDLSSNVLGPYANHSQNDAGLIIDWLNAASTSVPNRGFWAIGDGFTESNIFGQKSIHTELMLDYLATDLVHWNYTSYSGNTDHLIHLHERSPWIEPPSPEEYEYVLGVRNRCFWSNDVLWPLNGSDAVVTGHYDSRTSPGGAFEGPAGIFKPWSTSSPYLTLMDGWDIEHLTHSQDLRTVERSGRFRKVFLDAWSALCVVPGTPLVLLDVPAHDGDAIADFVRLGANPVTNGRATIHFGIARAGRVEIDVYDVSGRRIRRLADRRFAAGEHEIVWDGVDDAGRVAARGVYFTRVRYRDTGFEASRKLTLLR